MRLELPRSGLWVATPARAGVLGVLGIHRCGRQRGGHLARPWLPLEVPRSGLGVATPARAGVLGAHCGHAQPDRADLGPSVVVRGHLVVDRFLTSPGMRPRCPNVRPRRGRPRRCGRHHRGDRRCLPRCLVTVLLLCHGSTYLPVALVEERPRDGPERVLEGRVSLLLTYMMMMVVVQTMHAGFPRRNQGASSPRSERAHSRSRFKPRSSCAFAAPLGCLHPRPSTKIPRASPLPLLVNRRLGLARSCCGTVPCCCYTLDLGPRWPPLLLLWWHARCHAAVHVESHHGLHAHQDIHQGDGSR